MNTSEGLEKSVKDIVAKVLKIPVDTVKLQSRFRDDLGADSLDLVLLLYEMEDRLDLKLSDDEAKTVLTVADAVKLAEQVAHP
jgi:acyl carrier protein